MVITFVIILISFYGLCTSKNTIKSIIFLNVVEASIILFFLKLFHFDNSTVPIGVTHDMQMVDPLPQALMITTIVIGASVTALALIMSIKIYRIYGTIQWADLFKQEA